MESYSDCAGCLNNLCYVRQFCSANWIDIINKNKNQFTYEKGQQVFREGDRIFGLYFIKEGKIKIISTGLNGREQIVRLANAGHIIGHRGNENETYPIGAVALEKTRVCFLDNNIIYDVFMHNPKFTFALMMFYSAELRRIEVKERLLTQMTIREKVADALLYLNEKFGMDVSDNSLNVILSRQEIGDMIGIHSEQVTRELTEFENEKLITKQNKKICITNPEGLYNVIAAHHRLV